MPDQGVTSGIIDRKSVAGRRVLTGFRPTGPLHIGHLFGNLKNLVDLQGETEVFVFVADWHMLSTDFDRSESLPRNTWDLVADLVAAGIDPDHTYLYRQSDLPEVAELCLYFSMITPISWLERNPTYKEQLANLDGREIATHGFLGYPILQGADIVIVGGEVVPVGDDQLPHLEITREVVRRFHHLFGGDFFPEPLGLLGESPRVPGSDGRKMSKSYGNAIFLADSADQVDEKVKTYVTDPEKIRLKDPGHPGICNVFALHELVTSPDEVEAVRGECESGDRGCVACKSELSANLNDILEPLRARRRDLESSPETVEQILDRGYARAKPIAAAMVARARDQVGVVRSRSAAEFDGVQGVAR